MPSEVQDIEQLRQKIIGLGEKSLRKSYYPELQQRILELEHTNELLRTEMDARAALDRSLKVMHERLSALFVSTPELILFCEAERNSEGILTDFRIAESNPAASDCFGISSDSIKNTRLSESPLNRGLPHLSDLELISRGLLSWNGEIRSSKKKIFRVSIVPLQKDQLTVVATDITDLEQVKEKLLAKNKELENYLYVASHDLRSPLVNIQGFSNRLAKFTEILARRFMQGLLTEEESEEVLAVLNKEMPKALTVVLGNVEKMDRLISGLLKISRTGRITPQIRKVNMSSLFSQIVGEFSYQIEQAGAQVSQGNVLSCYGDESLLHQLFSNLIGNALKYRHPDRACEIILESHAQNGFVVYHIRDNGIGIAEKYSERIWDVFYRVDPSSPASGEGLGLSIVKRIADKHNGRAWYESTEGLGSTFYVELPAEPFDAAEEEK